ncbi:MAG: hypothetical protein ACHBN1_02625 [Heteroscytonema crispum UTEX LB 1556]
MGIRGRGEGEKGNGKGEKSFLGRNAIAQDASRFYMGAFLLLPCPPHPSPTPHTRPPCLVARRPSLLTTRHRV